MDNDMIKVVDIEELVKLQKRLENISDQIQKLNLQNILDMSRDSIIEAKSIYRQLKEKNLLNNDTYKTKQLKISLSKEYALESNIMKIYVILARELENWRRLYLQLV